MAEKTLLHRTSAIRLAPSCSFISLVPFKIKPGCCCCYFSSFSSSSSSSSSSSCSVSIAADAVGVVVVFIVLHSMYTVHPKAGITTKLSVKFYLFLFYSPLILSQ